MDSLGGDPAVKEWKRSEDGERSRQVQKEKHPHTQLTELNIVTVRWNAGCS